eukprot:6480516-Amphidinium_carterae.1
MPRGRNPPPQAPSLTAGRHSPGQMAYTLWASVMTLPHSMPVANAEFVRAFMQLKLDECKRAVSSTMLSGMTYLCRTLPGGCAPVDVKQPWSEEEKSLMAQVAATESLYLEDLNPVLKRDRNSPH